MDNLKTNQATKTIATYLFKDYTLAALAYRGIYLIRNKLTSEVYIGVSEKTFSRDWFQEVDTLTKNKHTNLKLQTSWNNYQVIDFEFCRVQIFQPKDNTKLKALYMSEQLWIAFYINNGIPVLNNSFKNLCSFEIGMYLNDKAKSSFLILIEKLFLRYEIDLAYLDGLENCTIEEIEMTLECIPNITDMEYKNIKQFLCLNSDELLDACVVEQQLDTSYCASKQCIYYDSLNYWCKYHNELTRGGNECIHTLENSKAL